MTAVIDLIYDSMREIGANALEEPATDAEAQYCFDRLNDLIDTWNTESLMVYNTMPNTFAYVGGVASYTMGVGGDFNIARPVKIESAFSRINAGTQNEVDYPMVVTTNADEYSNIITKQIKSAFPLVMYDDGGYPLKRLYFWPVPQDSTYAPVLWSWQAIASFTNTSQTISLPPGYKRALTKNLAVEICPAFGAEPSNMLIAQAVDSKAQIKRINYTVDTLETPIGIPAAGQVYALPDFLAGY